MGVSARFVTTFHDLRPPYLFPKAGALRRRAVDFLVGRSDGAIFTDPEDLLAVGRSDGTAWIPIGANVEPGAPPDRDAARARWGFSAHDRVLTYFGFLNVSKGAENVLHVLAKLIERGVPARALFIGHEHGSSDVTNRETAARTRRQSAELGLADRVTWTGWLPPEGVSQALWTADVAVLPYIDGASLRRGSFLACLAHGVPVVTTRPRSWPELPARVLVGSFSNPEDFRIGDHVAELVDADESGALLAEAVGRVLEDQGRAHELSAAGRELVGRLSWGAIGAATTEFYERVLGAPARTAAGS
jgi:glycosyltransferase involved in cell wall biosynthesis